MSHESQESSSPLSDGEGPGVRSEKRCSRCGETKPLDAFHKSKGEKSGYQYNCKACYAAYCAANTDKIRERKRAYNAANAEAIREYNRAYKIANAESLRVYRAANAQAIYEYNAAYRAAHPEYLAAHRAAHPDEYRAKTQRRLARKKGNGGDGFTASQLKHMRATQNGECAYCMGLYHPHALTIDHIIPLDQGGPHEAANICLACPKCNFNKGNRTPDQWINRWYYHKSE